MTIIIIVIAGLRPLGLGGHGADGGIRRAERLDFLYDIISYHIVLYYVISYYIILCCCFMFYIISLYWIC